MEFTITPEVNSTQEFIEIANDFSNPLDLVREAISNAFDADATSISLDFRVVQEYGERLLKIIIEDNGTGMAEEGLKSFFDLGNSMRRETKDVTGAIGEKGHGTKVYFNSKRIEVISIKDGKKYVAVMDEPKKNLFDHVIPIVNVMSEDTSAANGTTISITGYNENRRDKFTHDQLKDYILWFTKLGSIERCFGIESKANTTLKLRGVDHDDYEVLPFGHVFPPESKSVDKLFNQYLVDAPMWYCKKIVQTKNLKNFPEIKFQAVFYVEGTKVKYDYNRMIRRRGYSAPAGAYTIQDRYGIWLCKDYMPIQRKNEWITSKGSEYTKFHAFVNCQALRLTANRGSVENTPSEILQDLREAVREIYEEIIQSDDWCNLAWLESEVESFTTVETEKSDFKKRIDKVNRAKIADFEDDISGKTVHLIEPQSEQGVFTIFMQLSAIQPDIFPFVIVDYDTHRGIDVIVKADDTMPIKSSKLYYVEFKNYLSKVFNHSFENLHSIVCWDINTTDLKNGEEVVDIAGIKRVLKIVPPENANDYTRYYLDSLRDSRKIEVFVLKYYLKEKFNICFTPRTEASTL